MKNHIDIKDIGLFIILSGGITALIAGLFYDSCWGFFSYPLVGLLTYEYLKKLKNEHWQRSLEKEFGDCLQIICTAMHAGSSMENALIEAEREMKKEHGSNSIMVRELEGMNKKVALRKTVEEVFLEFGQRSKNEDIYALGEVLSFAKRGGGNLVHIMENTSNHMRQKQEAMEEMALLIAGKRLEQYIMNFVPIGILMYLRLTSKEYLMKLYHNYLGVIFMSVCIAIYLLSLWISTKILDFSMVKREGIR